MRHGNGFAALAWASAVAEHDGPRYALVRRDRAPAGPLRRVVARLAGRSGQAPAPGVRPVSALASSRRVAMGASSGAKRDRFAPAHGLFDGHSRAPGGWPTQKKDIPCWLGARPQPESYPVGRFHDQAPPELRRLGPDLRPGPDWGPDRQCPQDPGLLRSHQQAG